MKSKLIALAVAFVCAFGFSSQACDATKGINGIDLVLKPGVSQVVTWDFSDCWFGITSEKIYVTKPRSKNGVQNALPSNTPLTVVLRDLTTGQSYIGGFGIYCVNACQSVCGHVLELTLTLSPTANKTLAVEVTQLANWGGACQ